MIPFLQAWRGYHVGAIPSGSSQPWATLYRVCLRIERAASWCKVACWRRSVGAR